MSDTRTELLAALKAATPGPWEEALGGVYGAIVNPDLETECNCKQEEGFKTCTESYGGRLIAESVSPADRRLVVLMHRYVTETLTQETSPA